MTHPTPEEIEGLISDIQKWDLPVDQWTSAGERITSARYLLSRASEILLAQPKPMTVEEIGVVIAMNGLRDAPRILHARIYGGEG